MSRYPFKHGYEFTHHVKGPDAATVQLTEEERQYLLPQQHFTVPGSKADVHANAKTYPLQKLSYRATHSPEAIERFLSVAGHLLSANGQQPENAWSLVQAAWSKEVSIKALRWSLDGSGQTDQWLPQLKKQAEFLEANGTIWF